MSPSSRGGGLSSSLGNDMNKSAFVTDDGQYRYWLARWWGPGKWLVVVGLNPSTADATDDDPTIRRCVGYAKSWGYDGLFMVNLFALRATDPKELKDHPDPEGPCNRYVLERMTSWADCILCAWGSNPAVHRMEYVASNLLKRSVVHVLGLTKDGHPRHPLYMKKDLKPQPWSMMR